MNKIISALLCFMISSASIAQTALQSFNDGIQQYNLFSPDSTIKLLLYVQNKQLLYTVSFNNTIVIQPSAMGLVINKAFKGNVSSIKLKSTAIINTKSPSRGVHSIAVNHCNEFLIEAKDTDNKTVFIINAKAFNDGIAFRYVVHTTGINIVNEDSTAFKLPVASVIWSQGNIDYYEGGYQQRNVADLESGFRVGPPLTAQLSNHNYIAITEAGNTGFAGMSLKYEANGIFRARLKGNTIIKGDIQTPWHVIEIGKDLNTLVNCDIIQNVSPVPDTSIPPHCYSMDWLVPGKSVWSWLSETDGGLLGVSYQNMLHYSALASELGFQYNLVDEGWAYWSDDGKDHWTLLKQLVDSSAKQNVKIWVWKSYTERLGVAGIEDSVARWNFFTKCKRAGVAGIKIDFFPGEQQAVLSWYQDALRDAAKLQLMLNFHGANKPTGQNYTWPNEMTREAVRGLENRKSNLPKLNTILPFTRFLAGPADYTPFSLNAEHIKGTTLTHQLATVVTFTSPFMCIAANPDSLILSPVKDILKGMPTEWDETIVLPQSKPGVLSCFARRKGAIWYLAIMNGNDPNTVHLDLLMLPKGIFNVLTVEDDPSGSDKAIIKEKHVTNDDKFLLRLKPGGGFVAKLKSYNITAEK